MPLWRNRQTQGTFFLSDNKRECYEGNLICRSWLNGERIGQRRAKLNNWYLRKGVRDLIESQSCSQIIRNLKNANYL